jgi:hypothetical protein
VRWIGFIGLCAAIVTGSADAMDTQTPCPVLLEEKGGVDGSPAQAESPLLADSRCEALMSRELRAPLLEIPQDGEAPMSLSLGAKNIGATLRFKVPFSF